MSNDYRLKIVEQMKKLPILKLSIVKHYLTNFFVNSILPYSQPKNIKKLVFNKKFLVGFFICLYTISWLIAFVFVDRGNKLQLTDLPYQEKVADGVWKLKNRDPIHQVLAQGKKADLTLKENKQISNVKYQISNKDKELYKWRVTNANGTKFEFGAVNSNTPEGKVMPVVRVVNKEGFFVQYSPKYPISNVKSQISNDEGIVNPKSSIINHYVAPKVKGNVISWEISKGITARYTMMQDRVKADYIVDDQWLMVNGQKTKWDGRLEFDVVSGNETTIPDRKAKSEGNENGKSSMVNGQSLEGSLMPGGDIDWFVQAAGETGPITTHFTFPAPVVYDAKHGTKQNQTQNNTESGVSVVSRSVQSSSAFEGEYDLKKIGQGSYELSILLPKDKLKSATWPLTIDPIVIDVTATATGTAYGNGRKILRDAWGNLIAFMDGGTGNDNVWYKNYNSTTWIDGEIDLDSGAGTAAEIAADLDSTGSAHLAFRNTTAAAIQYMPLKITRDGNNVISSIGTQAAFSLDTTVTTGASKRPSLIIANKGGGAGVEKVAVVYAMNATSGTIRGEFRFMQCDVADACNAAANWKSASEELNGSGTCADTGTGNVGMPTSTTCKGTADRGIINLAAYTSHQAVLTQVPGKPKRSPASVKKDINGTFTDLTNTIDNNTGTTDAVNSLTTTDYIYIGDDKPFSKATIDITNTNANAQLFTTTEYWNGASWVTLANVRNNTATTTVAFSEDGSIMFDEPSDWATTSVNSVSKYWIRLRPAGAFDATVSIAEVYVNDRNSKALIIIAGDDNTDDMGVNYAVWDEVTNSAWENKSTTAAGTTWTQASQAIDVNGANWATWTNFPLTMTVDYKNNITYLAYISGLTVGSSDIVVKSIPNNKDPIVAANWTSVGFPTVTEAGDIALSLTSDGPDIYLFYVLDPGTNSLVFRRCSPSGGGNGNTCDNASDWGSEKTILTGILTNHPQAVITKVTGDNAVIDEIHVWQTAVHYDRIYVDLTDKSLIVSASADDAFERDCVSGTDDQITTAVTQNIGFVFANVSCDGSVNSNSHSGYRFQNVTVAPGAAISSAYLDLFTNGVGTDTINFTIYAEDVDNSSTFVDLTNCTPASTCTGIIGEKTRTTSSASYSIFFEGYLNPGQPYRLDVTNLIQEIVCRGAANSQPCVGDFNGAGTWASGNALSIIIISTDSGVTTNNINFTGWDSTDPDTEPKLQINVGSTGKNYSLGSATQLATGSASFADFDHPLSTDEMNSVATTSAAATTYWNEVLADNPTVLLKMDEASGNLIDTQVGNDGAVSGTALTYRATGPTSGIPYGATFAANSIATITDGTDVDLGDGPFTLEYWLKITTVGVQPIILQKTTAASVDGYEIWRETNGTWRLTKGDVTNHIIATADTDTGWHHWVYAKAAAGTGKVYRDGVDATGSTAAATFTNNNLNLVIGNSFAGSMAGFAVYKSELSSTRVAAHYNNSILENNYAQVSATTNYASQSAMPAFMFKQNNSNNSNTYKIDATAIVKSTLATSDKPVYLQVYRGGSTDDWVTMASDNNTAADNDITLTSPSISTSTSEYYFNETPGIGTRYAACTTATANCWTYWRVYQDNPTTTFNNVLSVDYVNVSFSSPPGPDKVAFSNTARTLTAAVCNGAASVFTMELQQGTTPTNPTSTTVVRVTSNSSSYTIYSDDTCATPVTNGDFTYTTSENSKSVYIIDNKKSIITRTLTGTRQSGDTLTTGTQNYTVNAGAVSKLIITLPGQTFTDGTGNSGTVTNQLSGALFPMQINATDANFNVNTSYTGDKVLVFSGPGVGSSTPTVLDKNSAAVNYGSNTTITLSSGNATNVQTTLYKGETITITATDGGSYGNASASLTIDTPNTKVRGGSTIRGGTKIQ